MNELILSLSLSFLFFSCGEQKSPKSGQSELDIAAMIDFDVEVDMTSAAGTEAGAAADGIVLLDPPFI